MKIYRKRPDLAKSHGYHGFLQIFPSVNGQLTMFQAALAASDAALGKGFFGNMYKAW